MKMAKLPIAIVLPHAGLQIPPELTDRLALTPEQIFNEADAYTDLIYDFRDQVVHWACFPLSCIFSRGRSSSAQAVMAR